MGRYQLHWAYLPNRVGDLTRRTLPRVGIAHINTAMGHYNKIQLSGPFQNAKVANVVLVYP